MILYDPGGRFLNKQYESLSVHQNHNLDHLQYDLSFVSLKIGKLFLKNGLQDMNANVIFNDETED